MKTLVIIPAYNEELNIERVIKELRAIEPDVDYVIINDGSKDATADICREKGFNFIDLPINLGLSGAVSTGMKYAYYNGYDCALQYDGDGQHRPEYIQKLVDTMKSTNCDIVIGSRFKERKQGASARMLGSRLIQFAILITSGKRLYDVTSGMRLYKRNIIQQFVLNAAYRPEPDTLAFFLRNGVKIEEVQVEMAERVAGSSYLNLKNSFLYMLHNLTTILVFQWFLKPIGGKKKCQ